MKQVVILAGGLGTRLRPITEKIPKPLVEVAGRPFLYWQLLDLKKQNILDVVLLVGYLGEMIEEYFSKNPMGMNLRYSYEKEPLGTGGAIKNALPLLESQFWLLNGDSYLEAPLQELAQFHCQNKFEASVCVYGDLKKVPVPGNIKASGSIVESYSKGAAGDYTWVDAGVYCLNRSAIEMKSEKIFQLESLWPGLIQAKKLGAFPVTQRFYDIGTPERLKEFENVVRGERS